MKILFQSVYYQLVIFLRLKAVLFYIWIFPIFLFTIFGLAWGIHSNYIMFLLTGIIGMTLVSEGLYAIGPVMKEYYASGLIRYLKKMPVNIVIYFTSYIVSRVISMAIITFALCVTAYFVFDFIISLKQILYISIGVIIGLFTFSFLGLLLSFSGLKKMSGNTVTGIIGYTIIFTANTFYPASEFNKYLGMAGDILPLNSILAILRGQDVAWIPTLLWVTIPMVIFVLLFYKLKFGR